ncbi:uncharacterized protein BX663DRAFT_458289 [Cokeromyces recurvatus]|uniref:uncharacterized protein n=1 Tax=Cokeromyces recurvatus TaxID=90255 RepID=UPI00221EE677|nr:uncharacterized protein BX663DRAFT_458289 [Cokeromyces recurvatus]KAI7900606.1 hypothetical protein BX663DRAFT_458289 [Cokeromyces recurvatus]
MKSVLKISLILIYSILSVMAKGGGGGRGGGGGGGSRGGGGGSSGNRGGTGNSGSNTGGRGIAGTGSTPGSVSSKGGRGGFGGPPPYQYSNTRSTYTNYAPVYSGGYSATSRYGYYGFYNPALTYFWIAPPFLFLGYHSMYHRYNSESGYYYAPQITSSGSNTNNVIINGTTNSGKDDNYHYTFNISTHNRFPMIDHAFYSSSDPNSEIADFVYRLQFSQLVEFNDTNQNGFYDANEPILSFTSLQDLAWSVFQVSNITVPTNATQSYLQTETRAIASYNNTNTNFTVHITYRMSNVQINNTASIPMQPNSLEYDFALEGFPTLISNAHPNARLAILQVLSTHLDETIQTDINTTTPVDIANQIKTNVTYGLSVGNFTQGRLEYQPTVNITPIVTIGQYDAQALASIPAYSNNDLVWGSDVPASNRNNKIILVTIPGYSANNSNNNLSVSGFGYLNVEVMNALASSGSSLSLSLSAINCLLALVVAAYFMIY